MADAGTDHIEGGARGQETKPKCLHCPCYRRGGHCCLCKARKATVSKSAKREAQYWQDRYMDACARLDPPSVVEGGGEEARCPECGLDNFALFDKDFIECGDPSCTNPWHSDPGKDE